MKITIYIVVFIAVIIGWIMNIVTLIGLDWSAETIEVVLRIIGIVFVPLGAILGYI